MPNLILFNGKLHTQDERYPDASAIAVRDGKILALGSDVEMLALARPETEKIDLQGRRVLPGLADAHIHFYEWAVLLRMLVLDDVQALDELLARVRDAVAEADAGAWIVGQGWNQDRWAERVLPTRADLDVIAPHNPVILWRKDLHLAVVNSAALAKAGLDRHTPNPEMGVIQRDAQGAVVGLDAAAVVSKFELLLPPTAALQMQITKGTLGIPARLSIRLEIAPAIHAA